MCFMGGSKSSAPPPPPPPPPAPPMLEQEAPELSEATDDNEMLNSRTQGLRAYKVERRNRHFAGNNPLTMRREQRGGGSNSNL